MNNEIQKILDDLYKIDPSLAKHEVELIKLIDKLLAARPNYKLDEEFIDSLRTRVLEHARELNNTLPRAGWLEKYMNLNKFAYAALGAAATLIVVIPLLNYLNHRVATVNNIAQTTESGKEIKIARLENDAFGTLTVPAAPESAQTYSQSQDSGAAASPKAMSETAPLGMGGGGGGDAKSIVSMPYPGWDYYEYKYVGSDLPVPASTLPVYSRVADQSKTANINDLAALIGPGFPDITRFENLKLNNFNIAEDRDFGYNIFYDAVGSTMNIDMLWERWPQPGRECTDQACWDKYRLTVNDVPNDANLIATADTFLSQYGINMSNYGPGEVRTDWRRTYDLAEDKSLAWIPDSISVVYPLLIEGRETYDESGYKNGLTVNVSIRYDKVAGVYGLKTLDFKSSDYAMETDTARILKLAENGGTPWGQGKMEGAKTVTVELGDPSLELVGYYRYDQTTGKSDELYVPAYVFPVMNPDDASNLFKNYVVVIIAKEIMDERDKEWVGIPQPMPLLEKGMGASGGGSAVAPAPMAGTGTVAPEANLPTDEATDSENVVN